LPIGPERYNGLPGLIVKLEFAKRSSKSFILNTIEYKPFVLSVPNINAVVVSPEEIVRPGLLKDKLKNKKWRAGARELLLNDN
jgi:GLPGLI family protein